MVRIQTQMSYVRPKGKTFRLPSQTQPDQALSLLDLITNHTTSGREDFYFDEDEDLPDPRSLDLTDFDEMSRQNIQTATQLRSYHEELKTHARAKEIARQQVPKGESAPAQPGNSEPSGEGND